MMRKCTLGREHLWEPDGWKLEDPNLMNGLRKSSSSGSQPRTFAWLCRHCGLTTNTGYPSYPPFSLS